MESARGYSCLFDQRRGPAASGEDRVPSPDQKFLPHLSTSPKKTGMKTDILLVDTAPHGVETPTPLADC